MKANKLFGDLDKDAVVVGVGDVLDRLTGLENRMERFEDRATTRHLEVIGLGEKVTALEEKFKPPKDGEMVTIRGVVPLESFDAPPPDDQGETREAKPGEYDLWARDELIESQAATIARLEEKLERQRGHTEKLRSLFSDEFAVRCRFEAQLTEARDLLYRVIGRNWLFDKLGEDIRTFLRKERMGDADGRGRSSSPDVAEPRSECTCGHVPVEWGRIIDPECKAEHNDTPPGPSDLSPELNSDDTPQERVAGDDMGEKHPPSGLVERVAMNVGLNPVDAQAAIKEVADWLDEKGVSLTASRLRREVADE